MENIKILSRFDETICSSLKYVTYTSDTDAYYCLNNNKINSIGNHINKKEFTVTDEEILKLQSGIYVYVQYSDKIIAYDTFHDEIINEFECPEIRCISVSPDHSIVLIINNSLDCIILSNELEFIDEFKLEKAGFGKNVPYTVGWGSKQTQFFGKAGKESRTITENAREKSEFDLGDIYVAWKDDGEYFVVSWLCQSQLQTNIEIGARMLRVFSREGELYSTSEAIDKLENGLCWRTNVNLIAVSCRSKQGLELVFVEQNGLKHGGFVLYSNNEQSSDIFVSKVEFNDADSMCAVLIVDKDSSNSTVNLYTSSNYHWFLKQSFNFTEILLDMFLGNQSLDVFDVSGVRHSYSLYVKIDRSMVQLANNESSPRFVGVVDKNSLLFTSMKNAVVPLPFCGFKLEFPRVINFVSFPCNSRLSQFSVSMKLIVQLTDLSCQLITLKQSVSTSNNNKTTVLCKNGFGKLSKNYEASQVIDFSVDGVINCVEWKTDSYCYIVVDNQIYEAIIMIDKVKMTKLECQDILVGNVTLGYNGALLLQSTNGDVYLAEDKGKNMENLYRLSGFYETTVAATQSNILIAHNHQLQRLVVNGESVSGTFLSILSHDNICLLATTLTQKLAVVRLDHKSVGSADIVSSLTQLDLSRPVETGARLVSSVSDEGKVVLVMPRGNYETIYPHSLVLDQICRLLDANQYSTALRVMRRNRINLNLLYDYNPRAFLINVAALLSENVANDFLQVFVSDLTDADVTTSFYKHHFSRDLTVHKHPEDKVNVVCQKIINSVEQTGAQEQYLTLVLSCYVKLRPCASDKALTLLCNYKKNGQTGLWDKGIKFLKYLISIEDLYKVALATYDLSLALEVAQKTNMDPKEYVDFLNELKEYECEQYRRFLIDLNVKQHQSALANLAPVAHVHWHEFVTLVADKAMYEDALQHLAPESVEYDKIVEMYAEHVGADKQRAGSIYMKSLSCAVSVKACECFIEACLWREYIVAARKAQLNEVEVTQGLERLAQRIGQFGKHSDCVVLYEHHLNDKLRAYKSALDGFLLMESLRLSSYNEETRLSFMQSEVTRVLEYYHTKIQENTKECREKMERLTCVRNSFIETFKSNRAAGNDNMLEDFMSDSVSTVSSAYSNYSTATSKRGRTKAKNKKLWSDKQGSQKEEVGLIEKLYNNIQKTQNFIQNDIKELLQVLYLCNKDKEAALVTTSCNNLLKAQCACIPIVWDEFVLGNNWLLQESEVQISTHIKVSYGPQYLGRRKYLIDEIFMKMKPDMKISNL